jgi:hypothetical protein
MPGRPPAKAKGSGELPRTDGIGGYDVDEMPPPRRPAAKGEE